MLPNPTSRNSPRSSVSTSSASSVPWTFQLSGTREPSRVVPHATTSSAIRTLSARVVGDLPFVGPGVELRAFGLNRPGELHLHLLVGHGSRRPDQHTHSQRR